MQDKDTETLQNQRRKRKRIGRIKSAIVITISGWIVLSLLLIIGLYIKTMMLERKIDNLSLAQSRAENMTAWQNETSNADDHMISETEMNTETEEGNASLPLTTGVLDVDNLAEEGDIHKVYLTFDNGPSENTAKILDVLAEYGVKATFFVTGKEDEESAKLYQRIVNEGHTLGMHSYSNRYSAIYQSKEAFEEDYKKLKDYLYEVTGVECRYYRFLGGSSNQISNVPMSSLIQYLNEEQTVYFDWNVSAGDAASSAYTSDEIVENVVRDVVKYKTSVVLLHDSEDKSATVEAIAPLIEALQEMNAQILPIDENTQVIQYVKADSVE